MKKKKTYEISVIDKTYSNTISDETKFYTSDTALELGFELKETEYTFESAEIVLLNIDDRSLVTRPVAKVLGSFTYELEDDITAHYGEWRGQVRFEKAGEIYVSSPVKFRIENDLSNDRPPQLSDVQSWVSLKRYADDLVDDLKQAVLSVEGIEDTFNANELERQSQFESAEQSRQDNFEANESERDETFSTNEIIRQTKELEREKAEGTRQTVFDDNESIRTETFSTNEVARQANEEARELAEDERENSEAQRKIDHKNRSAELDGKADKVVIKNEIVNGDFSTTDISHITSTLDLEVLDGRLKASKSNWTYVSGATILIRNGFSSRDEGDIYYVKSMIKVVGDTLYNIHFGVFAFQEDLMRLNPNDYRELKSASAVFSPPSKNFAIRHFLQSADYVEITLDDIVTINLTKTFGAGNEPTKEEMDELIKITGYIDYEYALNNKDLLMWTLTLIRSNKNAIITLGGTI